MEVKQVGDHIIVVLNKEDAEKLMIVGAMISGKVIKDSWEHYKDSPKHSPFEAYERYCNLWFALKSLGIGYEK